MSKKVIVHHNMLPEFPRLYLSYNQKGFIWTTELSLALTFDTTHTAVNVLTRHPFSPIDREKISFPLLDDELRNVST